MQFIKWKGRIGLSATLILIAGLFTSCGSKILSDCEEYDFISAEATIVIPEPSEVPAVTPELTSVPLVIPDPSETEKKDLGTVEILENNDKTVKTTKTNKATKTKKTANPAKTDQVEPHAYITSLETEDEQKTVTIYTGYIIDRDCLEEPGPEKDTLDCLLMESCRESGYGLAVKSGDAYEWYEFDAAGKDMAYEILKNTIEFKKISVTVEGFLVNNILAVNDMYENTD